MDSNHSVTVDNAKAIINTKIPYPALLETGKFYLRKQGRSTGIPIRDILEVAEIARRGCPGGLT